MRISTIPLLTLALLCGFTLAAAECRADFNFPVHWQFEEFQPDIKFGGRANTIAVNPADNKVQFVASESGGLFESHDGGGTWRHVESFRPHLTNAIAYLPSNPQILIATAKDLFSFANADGGIWRSADGGNTWDHIPNPPLPAPVAEKFEAREISIAPDTGTIYVATSAGISRSADNGVTWTALSPVAMGTSSPLISVRSIVAQIGNRVVAGGVQGIFVSRDGGATWIHSPSLITITDLHGLAASPYDPDTFFAVDDYQNLRVSENGGVDWTGILSAPTGVAGCGGIGFVKPILSRGRGSQTRLTLWYSERCRLWRTTVPLLRGTDRFDYAASTFTESNIDHFDTRDLAFGTSSPKQPVLLATDGGLHRTHDGGANWTLTGSGPAGYNALQIYEVKSQHIADVGRYDLYFATQDNWIWASKDSGLRWPFQACCEGWHIELEKTVATEAESQITYVVCAPCKKVLDHPLLPSSRFWFGPAGSVFDQGPAMLSGSLHVENVSGVAPFTNGLAITGDLGATWTQYAAFPESWRGIPQLSYRTAPALGGSPLPRLQRVQYQAIRTGFDPASSFEVTRFVRVARNRRAAASVSYPAMVGFGGLGYRTSNWLTSAVFAVDPTDSEHLIAPDLINAKMQESHDGGQTWAENTALTGLVTDSGRLRFNNDMETLASVVSFNDLDPEQVVVGMRQGGLLISTDRGRTWAKVADSERATDITSVTWKSSSIAYVATFGRGLWRLTGRAVLPAVSPICDVVDCIFRYVEKGDPGPERFRRGIVVLDGRILGVRAESGKVAELFVTPGSAAGVVGDARELFAIKVSESNAKVPLRSLSTKVAAFTARGAALVGVALDENGAFYGGLYSRQKIPTGKMPAAGVSKDLDDFDEPGAPLASPTAGRPYIRLRAEGGSIDKARRGEGIAIDGAGFPPAAAVELLMDGSSAGTSVAAGDGSLSIHAMAPGERGSHTAVVRDAKSQAPFDGLVFTVMPEEDEDEPRESDERTRDRRGERP